MNTESILDRLGGEVTLDHERDLESDGMVKFAQIETGELADLFKTVYERIPVYEELPGGLGDVQIVFEEALDGHERFAVEGIQTAVFEDFLEEHFAQRGRKLIDQSADTEVFVADDVLFGVEYLADLQSDLRFLVGAGEIFDIVYYGTDTDGYLGIEFGV